MRTLTVITIGLLLAGAGQLFAQTTDGSSSGKDPFGPIHADGNAAEKTPPTHGKSNAKPNSEPADQSKKQVVSQADDLFPPVLVKSLATVAHRRIGNALNSETTFDFLDQPLKDVVESISFDHNIPIIIDTNALEDCGIDTRTPITKSLKGISLRSALRLMLRDLELTFVIRDEVIQITTTEFAESLSSTRFYHVAKLLPLNGDGKVLVEMITTLVAPDTWCSSDSAGAIIYVEHLETLAIRQTYDVFHEIEELLATMKQLAQEQQGKQAEVVGRPY